MKRIIRISNIDTEVKREEKENIARFIQLAEEYVVERRRKIKIRITRFEWLVICLEIMFGMWVVYKVWLGLVGGLL